MSGYWQLQGPWQMFFHNTANLQYRQYLPWELQCCMQQACSNVLRNAVLMTAGHMPFNPEVLSAAPICSFCFSQAKALSASSRMPCWLSILLGMDDIAPAIAHTSLTCQVSHDVLIMARWKKLLTVHYGSWPGALASWAMACLTWTAEPSRIWPH